jgi:glycosyltransferase involved in cell wall biosynthesis
MLAFFKRLYRKKLFIVVGGYDVAAIGRFNYGAHRNTIQSRFIRYSLNHATCLLPNSESMVYNENRFIQDGIVYGGIRHFAPDTRAQICVVPNGFDSHRFHRLPKIEKRDLAMTVAVVEREKTFYMKGINRFIQTAREIPSFDFLIVGISNEFLNRQGIDLPANLKTQEVTGNDELISLYSEARVFCLFSLSEGMPNALCEAMLCECVPVGTEVTSIPEIIGETGYVIHSQEQEEYTEKVKKAFEADILKGVEARQRIASRYPPEIREEKIVSLLLGS